MDSAEAAANLLAAMEDGATQRCRSTELYLAVYITRKGVVKCKPAHSKASALMAMPTRVLGKGLWMITRSCRKGWVIVDQQFNCMTPLAAQQFAQWTGDRWMAQLELRQAKHLAGIRQLQPH